MFVDERLPVHIDPVRMAETRRLLEGQVALAEMTRLLASLEESSGDVRVSLEFGIDEEGIRYMRGHLSAQVALVCQRCLETLRYPIDSEFALGLLGDVSEAESLPSRYEPLVLDGKPLFLRDVIEDELLLALPIVPRHPQAECSVRLDEVAAPAESGREDTGQAEKGDNPFSVLADMKTDRKL